MIPIANKPILFYGLEDLKNAGITDIGIILGPIKEGIEKAIGDGSKFGVKVTYIDQPEPKGIAHAILIAEDFIGNNPFVVYLGDNLLKNGIKKIVKEFQMEAPDELLLLTRIKNPNLAKRFGIAEIENGKVVKVIEKPKKITSDLVMIGVYMFKPIVFDAIRELKPSWRNELEITDAIQKLIDLGCKVIPRITKGWWKDTGKPEDLLEANQLVLTDLKPCNKGHIEEQAIIRGKIFIDEGTIIRGRSLICGPVTIGKNCDIGPNVYIGPYTSIGDNTVIKNSEIEQSIILGDSLIECEKRIMDSIIGRYTRILSSDNNLPKGIKLLLGDRSLVTF